LKYKIVLWSFGYDYETGFNPQNSLKDLIRLKYYQKADAVIFYWEKGKEEIEKYSKTKEHYFVAPNTINTDILVKYKNDFDKLGKGSIKKHLKVFADFHFVFVGRLIPDKEVLLLLKAVKLLENSGYNFRVTIIGDGCEINVLKKYVNENGLDNVYFLGEILDQYDVSKWIYISDAFILPGRLGNSVVQSFCLGVPIVSQEKEGHFHGEGIGYIKNNINSLLCSEGDVVDLKNKMEFIILNPEYSTELGKKAYKTVTVEASTERFIEGFEEAINYVSASKY